MGQCSTLPTEGRTAASNKRGDNASHSSSHRNKEKSSQKATQGPRSSFLQVQTQKAHPQMGGQYSHMQNENIQPQGRNPETHMCDVAQPMDEDYPRDDIPQPPDIAIRTRCYKLNLDSDLNPQPSVFLGPFTDMPPPLTYSASDDSSSNASETQIAIRTATIFRGITVGKDGTILSQNARATRSNRGAKNKRGEKSRQATKIDKANDLVEESMLTGKAPESDEPANMMSLVIMGEYDDMKYLVRDGSKKIREASELPDDALLAINRPREGTAAMSLRSPRKRESPNYVAGQRTPVLHTPNKSRSIGLPQSSPPKLKSNPKDRPSSRRQSRDADGSGRQSNANGEGDWSNALSFSRGFHSIWNCGGTGEESPVSPKDGCKTNAMGVAQTPYTPVFEGRDSNYGQAREAGVTTRAN